MAANKSDTDVDEHGGPPRRFAKLPPQKCWPQAHIL